MQIPKEWRDFLATVRRVDPAAVIAGGAIRDFALSRPVKDIDIFVQPGFDHEKLAGLLGYAGYRMMNEEVAQYLKMTDVREVWTYSLSAPKREVNAGYEFILDVDSTPVQIIELSAPTDLYGVIRRMDFGLCQIGHDGVFAFYTADYVRDLMERKFTLIRTDDASGARARKRAERLSIKYSDFQFVFPTHGDSK